MLHEPLYRIRTDPESFTLQGLELKPDGTFSRREVTALELSRRLFESPSAVKARSSLFYIAALILGEGERWQRRSLQRLRAPRTHNIKAKSTFCTTYLDVNMVHFFGSQKDIQPMEQERLHKLLAGSLESLKRELKLPEGNRKAACYTLTAGMYENIEDEGFKQAVDRFVTSVGIPTENNDGTLLYTDDLNRLEVKGEDIDSDLWAVLKEKILKTESREHLSALSLTTGKIPGTTYISLANTHGHCLTMESWKFVALLEKSDSPRKLADLVELKRQEPDSLFAFNLHREGEIFAQLDASESILRVVCRSTKNAQIAGRANFVIDIDYALCVYIALKRLREDQERFTRLKEEANSIVCPEVFEHLFQE